MSKKQKDEILHQLHLSQFGMSGHGVRIRQLDPDVVKQCERLAAEEVGTDGTPFDLFSETIREGMCRMVAEVTKAPVRGQRTIADPKKPDEQKQVDRTLNDDGVEWRPVTLQEMKSDDHPFTSKDITLLEHLYQKLHTVSQLEVEMLMGKSIPVSTE